MYKKLFFCLIISIEFLQALPVVTIGFMGDVMLGRSVDEMINKTSYRYPWGDTLSDIKRNDLTIINLETTLTTSTKKVPKVFNFKASPEAVNVLKTAHIQVANIANNHILDFSVTGLLETIATLKKAQILYMGAGRTEAEARKPLIITVKNIKIGILGATDNEPTWEAKGRKPGTNYIAIPDTRKIKEDIDSVRSRVDMLIVSLHWGPNMRQRPTAECREFAHKLIDYGVDIIHGHSAHVFQGIEIYKKKLILYDTGDFIDDYAVDPVLQNNRSFLFKVKINKTSIEQVELIPVIIQNMQVNRARGKIATQILDKMRKLSAELGTVVTRSGKIFIN